LVSHPIQCFPLSSFHLRADLEDIREGSLLYYELVYTHNNGFLFFNALLITVGALSDLPLHKTRLYRLDGPTHRVYFTNVLHSPVFDLVGHGLNSIRASQGIHNVGHTTFAGNELLGPKRSGGSVVESDGNDHGWRVGSLSTTKKRRRCRKYNLKKDNTRTRLHLRKKKWLVYPISTRIRDLFLRQFRLCRHRRCSPSIPSAQHGFNDFLHHGVRVHFPLHHGVHNAVQFAIFSQSL